MLKVYARHQPPCPQTDINFRRCKCPKYLNGIQGTHGTFIRISARTRSWEKAEQIARDLDARAEDEQRAIRTGAPLPPKQADRVTIEQAVARYVASKQKESLDDSTIKKIKRLFEDGLVAWGKSQGLMFVTEITTAHLDAWRNTWNGCALTNSKQQHRVKGFFKFCLRMGWIKHLHENPAEHLSKIKVQQKPTDYLPRAEFDALIDATYIYKPKGWVDCRNQAERLRVLILLMRWSGLAIRDAVTLERSRLNDRNELFLYRAKTQEAVFVPLPAHVAHALRTIPPGPKPNPAYFFWTGNGDPKSAVADWQRSFRRLAGVAAIKEKDGKLKRVYPHMLRDTFAVEMLLSGVPMDQVSLLLGHSSIKTTEKSYSPFVKARQEQLAESVRQAWAHHEKVTPISGSRRRAARG